MTWRASHHARRMMEERGFTWEQVLDVVENADVSYTQRNYRHSTPDSRDNVRVFQKGGIGVVGDTSSECVITVLHNIKADWGSHAKEEPCAAELPE